MLLVFSTLGPRSSDSGPHSHLLLSAESLHFEAYFCRLRKDCRFSQSWGCLTLLLVWIITYYPVPAAVPQWSAQHPCTTSFYFFSGLPKCWTLPSASTATLLSAGGALPARGPVSVSGLQVQSPPGLTCPSPVSRSSCSPRKDVEFIGFPAEQLLGRGGLVLRMLNYIKFLVVRGKNLIFTFSFHLQKYVISSNSLSQMAFIWLMNYRVLFSYKNTLERFESLKLWWKPRVLLSKWGEWSGTFSPSFPQTAGWRVFNKFFLQCLWLISSLVT